MPPEGGKAFVVEVCKIIIAQQGTLMARKAKELDAMHKTFQAKAKNGLSASIQVAMTLCKGCRMVHPTDETAPSKRCKICNEAQRDCWSVYCMDRFERVPDVLYCPACVGRKDVCEGHIRVTTHCCFCDKALCNSCIIPGLGYNQHFKVCSIACMETAVNIVASCIGTEYKPREPSEPVQNRLIKKAKTTKKK